MVEKAITEQDLQQRITTMTSMDDRKQAYENKFANDEAFQFKVEARACKLFGLWIATEHLGLSDEMAAEYAKTVVAANLEESGFGDVKRKVNKDLDAKGVTVSDHTMDTMLDKFLEDAKEQLA